MRILFLGDVVGISGCSKLTSNLLNEIDKNKIDFVIVNGENAAVQGVGLTKEICKDFFNCGVDVITCLLYTSPSPRDQRGSRMPSSA